MSDDVPVVLRILAQKDAAVDSAIKSVKDALAELDKVQVGDSLKTLKEQAGVATKSLAELKENFVAALSAPQDIRIDAIKDIVRDLKLWQNENRELLTDAPQLRGELAATYFAASEAAKAASASTRELATENRKAAQESTEAARALAQEQAATNRLISQTGTQIGLSLEAAGAGLLGFVGASLLATAQFDQLRARMTGLKDSAEDAKVSLDKVADFAKGTGLDLKGLESAAVQLEQFGQKSEVVLSRVAALAAAKGRAIEATANIIGRIAEGDQRSFQLLARQYQITAQDLRQFGAVYDEVKGKIVNNTETAEQNTKALLRLIDTKFGNAVALQANTLTGAMNQAKTAVTLLADSFGQTLAPTVIGGLHVFADITNALDNGMSPGMKQAAIFTALAGGAALSAAGAFALAATALFAVNVQLQALAVNSPLAAQAVKFIGTNLVKAALGADVFAQGAAAFVSSAAGMATGVGALVAVLGTLTINKYANDQAALGKSFEESSKKAASASQSYHEVVGILTKLGDEHKIPVVITGNAGQQIAGIEKAIKDLGDEAVLRAVEKAGLSLDALREKVKQSSSALEANSVKMRAVADAIRQIDSGHFNYDDISAGLKKVGITATAAQLSTGFLGDELRSLGQVGTQLAAAEEGLKRIFGIVEKVGGATEKAVAGVANLKDFLKFSEQIDSAQSLSSALTAVQQQIAALNSLPELKGLGKEQLAAKLLSDSTSEATKTAIKALLELDHEQDRIEKLQTKRHDDEIKARFKADELELRHRKAIGEDTLQAELEFVRKQMEAFAAGSEQRVKLEEQAAKLEKQIPEERAKKDELAFRHLKTLRDTSLQEEYAFIQGEIALFAAGSEQRIKFEEQAAALRKQILARDVKEAKEGLREQYEAAREVVDQVKNDAEHTPAKAIAAIDGVLAVLRKWQGENAKLLTSSAEVRKEFDNLIRSTNAARAAEVVKGYADNLKTLKEQFSQLNAGAVGEAAKLAVIEREIELTKRAQNAHLITAKAAETELAGLTKEKLSAEVKITEQKRQQAIKLAQLDIQNRQGDIKDLEGRLASGEKVGTQLKTAFDDQFKARLALIDREKAEQIAKAGGAADAIVVINKEAALKRTEVIRAETEREIAEYKKRQDALEASKKKKDLGFSGFGNFEIADFGQDAGTSARYQRGEDTTFLGDDSAHGFKFGEGDDSPAALYQRFLSKVNSKASPTNFNPFADKSSFTNAGSFGTAATGLTDDTILAALRSQSAPSKQASHQGSNAQGNQAAATDSAFSTSRPAPGSAGSVINITVNGVKGGPVDDVELRQAIERIVQREMLNQGKDRFKGY